MTAQCKTPPGGLPSIVDASVARVLQSETVAVGINPGDLIVVQAPLPVPQGKHWIVTAACIFATTVGPPPVANFFAQLFKANAAAMGQLQGFAAAGVMADLSVMTNFLRRIQATLIPTLLLGAGSVTAPLYSSLLPYIILESGQVLAAFAVSNVLGVTPYELSIAFSYLQRDNSSC